MKERSSIVPGYEAEIENDYLTSAMGGDKDAIKWCQNHFIDTLPWDKRNNWAEISVEEIHAHPKCSWVFKIVGINNVLQCKEGFFDKITCNEKVIRNKGLVRLGLSSLRKYMES
ncbi:MAG: hypothetical protein E7306_14715 [Butyrivibrio sp.]|nr:hypothetical protein [Butyrivibrio sp.]MCR4901584.1 hypothetical protein [Butyrivibrio sp.]